MILTCPACQTQYIVPENALGTKARTVKCAACHYSWRQQPITVTEINLNPDEPVPSAPAFDDHLDQAAIEAADMARQLRWQQALQADIAATVTRPLSVTRFILHSIGWFIVFMVCTAIMLTYMRGTLVTVWPPSALFFEQIGLPAPAAGASLQFQDDAKAELNMTSVPSRLHVSGRFSNTFDRAVPLPTLQARLFNAEGVWLKDWAIPLQNVGFVGGNGTMAFDYTLPQVPAEAYRLTFRFVDE